MNLYIVRRWGVNQQGIAGVFTTKQKARDALREAKKAERDDYHTLDVEEIVADVRYECDELNCPNDEEGAF